MPVSVAYPGRDGAHSAAACDRLFPDGADLVPLPSFAAVAQAATAGDVHFGVLPIESSLSGSVAETHDILHDSSLSITSETILPIRHCLAGPELVPLEQIKIVRSHPAALDQCRRLLAGMPWATAIAAATTADAASEVSERKDPTEAAIASERAATMYGLTVIAGDVGDHSEAYTRFVSVAPYTRLDRESETWRTAFSFVTDHQPGALHDAIEPFGRHRVDLVQLVSRPIPHSPWRYRFDAVLDGHPLDLVVRETLAEVTSLTLWLAVFGSYPATDR
ncbi:MAG TPA: prephenate dehydratase domain-containing protein [Gaiellaceae bacterium]|jgi:chorismate mutase / prephenate dehydratase|nr:prephenate dehydratase domain-containing protein [Gaiellaceae bacterium]